MFTISDNKQNIDTNLDSIWSLLDNYLSIKRKNQAG